jgi:hypothetical protein
MLLKLVSFVQVLWTLRSRMLLRSEQHASGMKM